MASLSKLDSFFVQAFTNNDDDSFDSSVDIVGDTANLDIFLNIKFT